MGFYDLSRFSSSIPTISWFGMPSASECRLSAKSLSLEVGARTVIQRIEST